MKIEEARNLQELFQAVNNKFAFDKLLVLKIMGLCVAMTEMRCSAEVMGFTFAAWSDGKEGTKEELQKGFNDWMVRMSKGNVKEEEKKVILTNEEK